jgi:hypothetical protein
MLKISFSETPSEKKWILEGHLKRPWDHGLRTSWERNYQTGKQRPCIVDLNEVTFIDRVACGSCICWLAEAAL